MSSDLHNYSDDDLFRNVGELPNSQKAYWRDLEIRRRHFVMNKRVADVQIEAANAQGDAAEATARTAFWTRMSAFAIAASVLVMMFAALTQNSF